MHYVWGGFSFFFSEDKVSLYCFSPCFEYVSLLPYQNKTISYIQHLAQTSVFNILPSNKACWWVTPLFPVTSLYIMICMVWCGHLLPPPPPLLPLVYTGVVPHGVCVFLSPDPIISFPGWHVSFAAIGMPSVVYSEKQLHDCTSVLREQLFALSRCHAWACNSIYTACLVRQGEYTTPATLITICHPVRRYDFFTHALLYLLEEFLRQRHRSYGRFPCSCGCRPFWKAGCICIWVQSQQWLLIKEMQNKAYMHVLFFPFVRGILLTRQGHSKFWNKWVYLVIW